MSAFSGRPILSNVENPAGYRNLADLLPPSQPNLAVEDENWSQPTSPVRPGGSWFSPGGASPEMPLSSGQHPSLSEAIHAQILRGAPINFGTLPAVFDAIKNQNGIGLDDRKFLLENILVFLSRIPPGLPIGKQVEHTLLDLLYNDLPHPPSTYLGPFVHTIPANRKVLGLKGFSYREADGSNNNPMIPNLGAAHTPYARSVAASHVAPESTLPDPSIIFDTLMKRDKDVDHPTGLSSLFFAFANLIIHSLFSTRHTDSSINDTSSYLDLSPLYGVDQDGQDLVRRRDGTGRLWNDAFADSRLLAMPPSVCALLVVFSRNHNFIATRILEINESGKYKSDPLPSNDGGVRDNQDDEIFNRARLVNCGTFMQVIMRDYVGSILRMIPDLSPWHLSPFDEFRSSDHKLSPRGEGNVCSVEFNLLYRWHATTSLTDTKWLEAFWKKVFGDKGYDEITPREFGEAMGRLSAGNDAKSWVFGGLKRDATGRFDDEDLAQILQSATAESANAFRARGTPAVFKVIEILGIMQARKWGVCSLNEFRSFLGLKPYSSFKEWNPTKEIYETAERLYHDIDNLELYVGMQAEETRPSIPGSGLCSGYTMSRAILADAVTLIRGDRFLTVEYTPSNLTSWGFRDAQTDDKNGSFGGMLTKLLLRTLPRHYHARSAYAHFPLMVPRRMREFMMTKEPQMAKQYVWYRGRPLSSIKTVNSFADVKEVVTDSSKFGTPYASPMAKLTKDYGFYLVSGDERKHDREMIQRALFGPAANAQHATFYYEMTKELIADKAMTLIGTGTKTVDIVAHVINYVPVHWVATRVAGLSLHTKEILHGKYNEQELYGYLTVLFTYIYLDNPDSVNTWFLERHANIAADILLKDIKDSLQESSSFFSVRGITETFTSIINHPVDEQGSDKFLRHLSQINNTRETDDLMYNVFGIIVNSVANWAHAMTHVVNFYLDDLRKRERDHIVALSVTPLSEESERLLVGYAKEALRLDPPVAGVFREARHDCELSGTQLHTGQRIVANLGAALVDENQFGPNPSAVDPQKRLEGSPLDFVPGAHSSLDEDFSNKTMAQVLRAIFSKKNVRKAAGISGQLTRFTANIHGTSQKLYVDSKGQTSRWPQSLLVEFDT